MSNRLACSLKDLTRYFLKLGAVGFGGPVALVGYMQKDLVDTKQWVSQKDFNDGLALSQLCPGPIASQLCMYIGWLCGGWWGALCTGVALALPAFVIVMGLCWVYVTYGELPELRQAFSGMSGAVIAIILLSAWRLFNKSVRPRRDLMVIAVITFGLTVWTGTELLWVFIVAGIAAAISHRKFSGMASFLTFPGYVGQDFDLLKKQFYYFFEVGAMVFGSGMVIVPFLYQGVVTQYGWLNDSQFKDALAIALVTPGPAVITVAFMGFLISGFIGAILAVAGIFAPCYLFTVLTAPVFQKIVMQNDSASSFVDGVSAAAVGAIGGAVILVAQKTSWSVATLVVFAMTLLLSLKFKVPEALLILGAGVVGYLVL